MRRVSRLQSCPDSGQANGAVLFGSLVATQVLLVATAVIGFVQGQTLLAVLTLVGALSSGYVSWRLWTRWLRPIAEVTSFAAQVADGDLTRSLRDVHAGDLTQLAKAVEAAADRMRGVVQVMMDSGTSLDSAAQLLAEASGSMESSFAETSGQASAASASAEQVSHNVTMVSTASAELTSSVTEVSRSTHEAAAVADEAVATAEHTSEVMTRLGESSAEIGNVVKLITSIAAQTNLLALNATIEAARAGEAGRGFAVVAGEVKELAQETSRATDDISERIQAIQSDTQGAVEAIGRIREVIERIAGYQTTIAGAVEEQSSTAAEMSRSLDEAATGSAHIAGNVGGLATSAETALSQLSRTKGAASELVKVAQDLREVVRPFTCAAPSSGATR
ncbi:MAG TPA: methyl-accepting chemotaxis protein [Actinomycetales bacterium]|nr:methyl-accepting chemotaxis protein [Actinomycetales bacterium]